MKARQVGLLRRVWRKIFPEVTDFQALVTEQCRLLEKTLEALDAYLDEGRGEHAQTVRRRVDEAHALGQRNLDLLHRSFVTRIDREDIYMLITRVDHVFDYATTSVRELELLDVAADRWMSAMVMQLRKGAEALTEGFERFRVSPAESEPLAALARRAERDIESLYRKALAELFAGEAYQDIFGQSSSPSGRECVEFIVDRIKRREVYRHLSNAADRLARVGETLHDLSVKYA
jgi:uncharacterized protein Yka (UPF0111/DUF47 family)